MGRDKGFLVRAIAPLAILILAVALSSAYSGPSTRRPELTLGFSVDPVTADPRFSSNIPGQSIQRHGYEPLINHDRSGKLIPVLATSWKMINPTTLEFKLRRGVKFHNGEDFTAESVKYTIESIIAPDSKSPNKQALLDIAKIESPDPYTVRLITHQPSRPLLRNLTFWPIGMLPPKAAQELGPKLSSVGIGTGAYKLVEFIPGERAVFEAYDGYWGKKPSYARITFKIIRENGPRAAALEAGDVMMINNVPPDEMARINANPNLRVIARPTARIMFVAAAMRKPIMQNVKFRQALNVAINRSAIVNSILRKTTEVARSPIPAMVWGSVQMAPPAYNVARARQLLKDAGYQGEPIEFLVPNGRYLLDKQIGEAIAGYFQKAGVNVKINLVEWGQFASAVFGKSGTWDLSLFGWGMVTFDPDWLFRPMFHSKYNLTGYKNEKLDSLIDAGRTTFDERKAMASYKEIQQLLWDQVPYLFLYNQPQIDAINKKLKGYEPMPDEFMYFAGTTLE
ncbi:MAG: hypothetical protein HY660_14585 [Armatimonadetes bacterium]|nr:hypothetical protein [Armatimonadota bacterium]